MKNLRKRILAITMSVVIVALSALSFTSCKNKNKQGEQGRPGIDGQTPFIGENGNWWIGEVDTGVAASGKNGEKGDPGEPGEKGDPGEPGAAGIAPMFSFNQENGHICISYDNENSWSTLVDLSSMIKDGEDGVSITSCAVNDNGDLVIKYSNGQSDILELNLPKNEENEHFAVTDIVINDLGNLEVTLLDGSVHDLGKVKGDKGDKGDKGESGITPLLDIDGDTYKWKVSYDNGETWTDLGVLAIGTKGDKGDMPMIKIIDGYWKVSYDEGKNWIETDVKAEGTDGIDGENGSNGKDGRGIASLRIVDGILWVTYTDGTEEAVGKVTASTEGTDNIVTDPHTDGLAFYPIDNGMAYAVSIGNAIYMETIVIPATYKGKPITKILANGFSSADIESVLKRVEIPSSVKTIESGAFESCAALEYVGLADGLEYISANAFNGCSALVEITIPASVTEIGFSAFGSVQSVYFECDEEVLLAKGWNDGYLGCGFVMTSKEN